MYFPYLRGKQFELIALRELIDLLNENRDKVSPVIEPIKDTATLSKTLNLFKANDINFTLIINPQVGNLFNSVNEVLGIIENELAGYSNFQYGIILDGRTNLEEILANVVQSETKAQGFSIIHNTVISNIEEVKTECTKALPIINNIINFDRTNSNRRYYRNFGSNTRISLADYFESQPRNADYSNFEETQFSEEYRYYEEEGYKGFGDFLTIGDNYSESGFMPYAVAIHISYVLNKRDIRVRHFVSDSNGDTSDVGGKFAEANAKLAEWCTDKNIHTKGIDELIKLHISGHFPGLGSVKKLSIMNHIELITNLI